MKICAVEAELKPTVSFRNFANSLTNRCKIARDSSHVVSKPTTTFAWLTTRKFVKLLTEAPLRGGGGTLPVQMSALRFFSGGGVESSPLPIQEHVK
jgi:hypothetical protein